MSLFKAGTFKTHSGLELDWKIECDALSEDDWAGAARIAMDFLPPFGFVYGVFRGGLPFAKALRPYMTEGPRLIVDDVCTTGASLREARNKLQSDVEVIGVVLFARGPYPSWVTPIFSSPHSFPAHDEHQPDQH